MEKAQQRAALKRLQGIVNGRGDAEIRSVCKAVQRASAEILAELAPETPDPQREDEPVDEPETSPRRRRKTSRDRMARGGRDRAGE